MQASPHEEEPDVPTLGQNRAARRRAKKTRTLRFAEDITKLKAFGPISKSTRNRRSGRRKS